MAEGKPPYGDIHPMRVSIKEHFVKTLPKKVLYKWQIFCEKNYDIDYETFMKHISGLYFLNYMSNTYMWTKPTD